MVQAYFQENTHRRLEEESMPRELVKILLIESNPQDAFMVQGIIQTVSSDAFQFTHVTRLDAALNLLHNEQFDVILMDLMLEDSQGYHTFVTIRDKAPDIPLVILTDLNDDQLAVRAVQEGAEDYLVKGYLESGERSVSPPLLTRSIRYALERHRMQQEIKQYTQELEANEARFRTIIEKNADGIIIVDKEGTIQFVNPAAETIFGRRKEQLLNEAFGFPIVGGETIEIDVIRADGKAIIAEMRVVETAWENTSAYLATFRDITERKQAEMQRMTRFAVTSILAQSDTLYQSLPHLLQAICEGERWDIGEIWLEDRDTHVLRWVGMWHNPSLNIEEFADVSRSMTFTPASGLHSQVWMSGQPAWIRDIETDESLPRASLVAVEGIHTVIIFPILNGRETIGVMAFFSRTVYEINDDIAKMMTDIGSQIGQFTARRRAEEELRSAHRALRTLNECNQALIHATEEEAFLHDICRIIVEVGGYRMAWAGFAPGEDSEHIRIAAKAAHQNEDIETLEVFWTNTNQGQGPTRKALQTGSPCVAKNIVKETTCPPRNHQQQRNGFAASVALPLIANKQTFGILNIYAEEPDAFGREEVKLLMEMANDLAYGIMALRTRSERDQAERALRLYAERLKNMREIDQAILTAQTPEAIAQAALSHLRRLVPYQWASIVGYNTQDDQTMTLVADIKGEDTDETFASPGTRLPLITTSKQANEDVETTHYEEDIHRLEEQTPALKELYDFGIRSYISAPLIADSLLIGGINLGATRPYAFTEQHISIVHEVADQMAVAINHARLFQEVQEGRERLQKLSRRLMEIQEVERHHIARELHDEIGQSLTAVKISLQAILRQRDALALSPALKESIKIVDGALEQVRNLSLDLRPSLLDDLGLEAALRWYIDRQAQWAGFKVELVTHLQVPRLSPDLETVCFRVTQEAMTNIVRHAQASHVYVDLHQYKQELHLIIRDDGKGFDVHAAQERAIRGSSLGLLGMQERVSFAGGKIEILSTPKKGTEILASFPIEFPSS